MYENRKQVKLILNFFYRSVEIVWLTPIKRNNVGGFVYEKRVNYARQLKKTRKCFNREIVGWTICEEIFFVPFIDENLPDKIRFHFHCFFEIKVNEIWIKKKKSFHRNTMCTVILYMNLHFTV